MKLKRYENGQVQLRGQTSIMDLLFRVAIEIEPPATEQEATIMEAAAFALVDAVKIVGNLSKGPSPLRLLAALLPYNATFATPVRRIVVKGAGETVEWKRAE